MSGGAPPRAAEPAPIVLVVEDEAMVAMLVQDTLAEAGYACFWTPDGPGPGAPPFGAAVVDLRLEGGPDGREVVRALRGRHPALPVVVATGFHPEAPEADLRGLGGPTLRLSKPFDCDELLVWLAGALRSPPPAPSADPPPPRPRRRRSDATVPA